MRIYMMGVCGTGMGNAALLLKAAGHEVMGVDEEAYPPMSEVLKRNGLEILRGYDAGRLTALRPDLVVVGNVHSRGHPEVEWLLGQSEVPFVSMPEVLARLVLRGRPTLVVAGTHGKTTTAAMAAWLLRQAEPETGWLIGGDVPDLNGGAAFGGPGGGFVIEGDEYDCAFFDKRSKFVHYRPTVAVLNNLELDHTDIFRDIEDLRRSFSHLLRLVPAHGAVVVNGDDPELALLPPIHWCPVVTVGTAARNDYQIRDLQVGPKGSRCRLAGPEGTESAVFSSMYGEHNLRNACMAAVGSRCLARAMSRTKGLATATAEIDLRGFRGPRRRQELLWDDAGRAVLWDFAHHPSAVDQTIRALRQRFPGWELGVCFEARSNSSCRRLFQSAYTQALGQADFVFLSWVHRAHLYPDSDRLDLAAMAGAIGPHAVHQGDPAALENALGAFLEEGSRRALCFFSNGSFSGLPDRVAARAAARA